MSASPSIPPEARAVEGLSFTEGPGGLGELAVEVGGQRLGSVLLHGAHVTSFRPAGGPELLWMSGSSHFQPGKAVRGGVPICFPWFGPHATDDTLPSHGVARTHVWKLAKAKREADTFELAFTLRPHGKITELWPYDFRATYLVRLSPVALEMTLGITNVDREPFTFEAALHTYFATRDISRTRVHGLEGVDYIEKLTQGGTWRPGEDQPITFAGEVEHAYLDTTETCLITDAHEDFDVVVEKTGSHSTVVWNPHVAKSARMSDFGDDEWRQMLCIETANVADHAINLNPGDTHAMTQRISHRPSEKE